MNGHVSNEYEEIYSVCRISTDYIVHTPQTLVVNAFKDFVSFPQNSELFFQGLIKLVQQNTDGNENEKQHQQSRVDFKRGNM